MESVDTVRVTLVTQVTRKIDSIGFIYGLGFFSSPFLLPKSWGRLRISMAVMPLYCDVASQNRSIKGYGRNKMGGTGSTRWKGHSRRKDIESCTGVIRSLDYCREWRNHSSVILSVDGKEHTVKLWRLILQNGGALVWFICPHCSKRVTKLFPAEYGGIGCKHCLNLGYTTQRKSPVERARLMCLMIAERNGWDIARFVQFGELPRKKYQKRAIYEREKELFLKEYRIVERDVIRRLGAMKQGLKGKV